METALEFCMPLCSCTSNNYFYKILLKWRPLCSKQSSCSITNNTVSSLLQNTSLCKQLQKVRSYSVGWGPRECTRSDLVLQHSLSRDDVTGAQVRQLQGPYQVLNGVTAWHTKMFAVLCGCIFLGTEIGFQYENETSKINICFKRICYVPLAKGCDLTFGCSVAGHSQNKSARRYTSLFPSPWKSNTSNKRLFVFSLFA